MSGLPPPSVCPHSHFLCLSSLWFCLLPLTPHFPVRVGVRLFDSAEKKYWILLLQPSPSSSSLSFPIIMPRPHCAPHPNAALPYDLSATSSSPPQFSVLSPVALLFLLFLSLFFCLLSLYVFSSFCNDVKSTPSTFTLSLRPPTFFSFFQSAQLRHAKPRSFLSFLWIHLFLLFSKIISTPSVFSILISPHSIFFLFLSQHISYPPTLTHLETFHVISFLSSAFSFDYLTICLLFQLQLYSQSFFFSPPPFFYIIIFASSAKPHRSLAKYQNAKIPTGLTWVQTHTHKCNMRGHT